MARKNKSSGQNSPSEPIITPLRTNTEMELKGIQDWIPQGAIDAINGFVKNELNVISKAATNEIAKITNEYSNLLKAAQTIGNEVSGLPGVILDGVRDAALEPLKNIEVMAAAEIEKLKTEIADHLKPATDLINIIKELEANAKELGAETVSDITSRLRWVFKVLMFLLEPIVNRIEDVKQDLEAALKEAESNMPSAIAAAIVSILKQINPAVASTLWIVECISERTLKLPKFGLPFTPGKFHEFINGSVDGELEPGEREFRIELIGAIDRYIHNEYDTPNVVVAFRSLKNEVSQIRSSNEALPSYELLSGLIRTIVQTTFGFLFRLPHLPSFAVPKMSLLRSPQTEPKPSAVRMSVTFSRSISHPLRAISGLSLRGVWEFSSHNEALVESVASAIASTVAGVLEAAIQSVLSLVEFRELTDNKNIRCLRSYPKTIEIGQVYDVLWIRNHVPENLVTIIHNVFGDKDKYPVIEGLLKDYVAYMEVSQVLHEPDLKDETINVTSATWTGNQIEIQAKYKTSDDCQPVLRAYAGGKYSVLNFKDGIYSGTISNVKQVPKITAHVIARELAHGSKEISASGK